MTKRELIEALAPFDDYDRVLVLQDFTRATFDGDGNLILPHKELRKVEQIGRNGFYPTDITLEIKQ